MRRCCRACFTDGDRSCSGRDDHQRCLSAHDPVEGVPALRHGEQAVDADRAGYAVPLQPGQLVGHQGHQRGDHDREGAGLVVGRQGGDLVAERLPGAGRQHPEGTPAPQGRLGDPLLQRPSFLVGRRGPEGVEAEPPRQLLHHVVHLRAPGAGGVGAALLPEASRQGGGIGVLLQHPGRYGRVGAGRRHPGGHVGRRPGRVFGGGRQLPGRGAAGLPGQEAPQRLPALFGRRYGTLSHLGEEGVESGARLVGGQPVPGRKQLGRCVLPQLRQLGLQDLQG